MLFDNLVPLSQATIWALQNFHSVRSFNANGLWTIKEDLYFFE